MDRFQSTCNQRWVLAAGGLLLSLSAVGCQVDVGGQTLPSPWFLTDDVQYFPAGPEFKLTQEALALKQASARAKRLRGAPTPVGPGLPAGVAAPPPGLPGPGIAPAPAVDGPGLPGQVPAPNPEAVPGGPAPEGPTPIVPGDQAEPEDMQEADPGLQP